MRPRVDNHASSRVRFQTMKSLFDAVALSMSVGTFSCSLYMTSFCYTESGQPLSSLYLFIVPLCVFGPEFPFLSFRNSYTRRW